MWRKNRAPNGHYYHSRSNCIGVDLNRNFGYHWMGTSLICIVSNQRENFSILIRLTHLENGASTNPCSETYAGSHQDSEPETQSLQRFIKGSSHPWDAYLTFHSYGQYWIYPWGFASHMPDDYLELVFVFICKCLLIVIRHCSKAKRRLVLKLWSVSMEQCIKSDQQQISSVNLVFHHLEHPLTVWNRLDESAGGSDDWAKGVAQIKYVYTVELRPSDDLNDAHAHFAFMLPSTFIEPVGHETYVGVKEFLRALLQSKKTPKKSTSKY